MRTWSNDGPRTTRSALARKDPRTCPPRSPHNSRRPRARIRSPSSSMARQPTQGCLSPTYPPIPAGQYRRDDLSDLSTHLRYRRSHRRRAHCSGTHARPPRLQDRHRRTQRFSLSEWGLLVATSGDSYMATDKTLAWQLTGLVGTRADSEVSRSDRG